ncbi:cytochrome c nitrite reductase pentaheme subunit [Vibrio sp. JC009]|uniref:multiheme c-type cytochrome n=1 Tax=Vibrio sp. JC009 TaxID=2912314 RepID=UPI0023AF7EA8|nr:multiheme c-type cytochrome [Vibrio sp. JC009]WED20586.1 cytochrome c nitrite reductase pentaheme subunit [Vibrio sp. JC009]
MANSNLTIAVILKSLLILCLYGFSVNQAVAATGSTAEQSETATKTVKLKLAKSDKRCLQCHKQASKSQHVTHGQDAANILGKSISCVDCHNKIGSKHRRKSDKVVKYSSAQSKQGTKKKLLTQDEVLKANQMCVDCHEPKQLQEANWTHDVHALNLTCSNCHDVHLSSKNKPVKLVKKRKPKDPGVNVLLFDDHKTKVKMCVDCHSDFNQLMQKQEAE